MSKYRIVKTVYESGDARYQIQQKFICWWIDLGGEYWQTLNFAKDRIRSLEGNRIISEEVVE